MLYIKGFSVAIVCNVDAAYKSFRRSKNGKTFPLLGLNVKATVKVIGTQFSKSTRQNKGHLQWVIKIICWNTWSLSACNKAK
jgi:hypothetical protein